MCDERNPAPASDECISFPWPTDLVIALATQEAPPLPASDERSPRWRSLGGNAAQEWFAAKRSSTLGMLHAHIPLKGFAGVLMLSFVYVERPQPRMSSVWSACRGCGLV